MIKLDDCMSLEGDHTTVHSWSQPCSCSSIQYDEPVSKSSNSHAKCVNFSAAKSTEQHLLVLHSHSSDLDLLTSNLLASYSV